MSSQEVEGVVLKLVRCDRRRLDVGPVPSLLARPGCFRRVDVDETLFDLPLASSHSRYVPCFPYPAPRSRPNPAYPSLISSAPLAISACCYIDGTRYMRGHALDTSPRGLTLRSSALLILSPQPPLISRPSSWPLPLAGAQATPVQHLDLTSARPHC